MSASARIPSLSELAFEKRNKAYGAYLLRKRYPRYLAISLVAGVMVCLLMVLLPLFRFLSEPLPAMQEDYLLVVDYVVLPPPEELIPEIPAADPPAESPPVPVIQDSVKPEEERPSVLPEEEPVSQQRDTTGNSQGGAGMNDGKGSGEALTSQIDVWPKFPGGDEGRHYYLRRSIRYPEEAIRKMIQGTVIVIFVVETDGSVSNVSVSKSIGGGCDEEAVRVVRAMPRWEPGKRSGRPVRVMLRMPVVFRIPGRPG